MRGYEWMEGIPDYGLPWWVTREDNTEGWYATGYGGQCLAVFPGLEAGRGDDWESRALPQPPSRPWARGAVGTPLSWGPAGG